MKSVRNLHSAYRVHCLPTHAPKLVRLSVHTHSVYVQCAEAESDCLLTAAHFAYVHCLVLAPNYRVIVHVHSFIHCLRPLFSKVSKPRLPAHIFISIGVWGLVGSCSTQYWSSLLIISVAAMRYTRPATHWRTAATACWRTVLIIGVTLSRFALGVRTVLLRLTRRTTVASILLDTWRYTSSSLKRTGTVFDVLLHENEFKLSWF